MKLLVAGSRDYANQSKRVIELLDDLTLTLPFCHWRDIKDGEIVSGCAKGIDTAAILWAEKYNIPVKKFPAEWTVNGRTDMAAGFKRNILMAEYCDTAIIIWDKKSRGTKHMMSELDKRGKEFLLWDRLPVIRRDKGVIHLGM